MYKLLTEHLELQTRSIMTLSIMSFQSTDDRELNPEARKLSSNSIWTKWVQSFKSMVGTHMLSHKMMSISDVTWSSLITI